MSDLIIIIIELVGTVAFAVSGAMSGLKKNMDIFGIAILGLTTAVGGGIIRDLVLGITPPSAFRNPIYAITAIATALIVFLPAVRHFIARETRIYDMALLIMDSLGLGIFTVVGVRTAFEAGMDDNLFLQIFVGVVTGVGGGVLRDMMAGDRPYIFVKHFYACASIIGAIVCSILWKFTGEATAMFVGAAVIVVLRFLAAHYRWSLPKAKPGEFDET